MIKMNPNNMNIDNNQFNNNMYNNTYNNNMTDNMNNNIQKDAKKNNKFVIVGYDNCVAVLARVINRVSFSNHNRF